MRGRWRCEWVARVEGYELGKEKYPHDNTMTDTEIKINALLRPNIRSLKPYSSARDEFSGSAAAQVFLDANENSIGSPLDTDYRRYPDPQQGVLKQAIARLKGVNPDRIFLGNGSDEAIDLLFRAFCEPGADHAIILPPTYGMYAVQAGIQGSGVRKAPLRPDFSPDAEAVRAATDAHSKLLFLCSPNNPTGNDLPEDFILKMLGDFPGLVVLDEAYADFSETPSRVALLDEFPNLVILQTLSKAWGLAGLRIGMAFAHPFIINILNKIKYPYNLNSVTTRLATEALSRENQMTANAATLLAGRARLEAALPGIPCVQTVFPSQANFLLVRVTDADGIYQYLIGQGIVVRNRTREMHCENCLRITVGTFEENERLIAALANYKS